MTESSNNAFEPRKGLKRVLKCRIQTKFFFYYLILVSLLGTLNYGKMVLEGGYASSIMIVLFVSLITMLLLIFFVFRKFVYSELEILEQGIQLREYKKPAVDIKFDEIASVRMGSLFRSPEIYLKDGRKVVIDSNYERGDYLVESIAAARKELIDREHLVKVRNQAILDDHANARIADQMTLRNILMFHFPLVVVMSVLASYLQILKGFEVTPAYFIKLLSVFILVHALANDLLFRAFELIFATKTQKNLEKDFKNVVRDRSYEKKVYRLGFTLLVLGYFAAILFLFWM